MDTLLLADEFKNFRNMCLEVYELDLAYILSTLWLACQAALTLFSMGLYGTAHGWGVVKFRLSIKSVPHILQ